MKIRNLDLLNFRNYEKCYIDFSDDINLIYGKNGEGKTNIVEALYLLGITKSFRTSNDKNMIKIGKQLLKVTGKVINNYVSDKYSIVISDAGKKVTINETNYNRLSDYISKINIILFCREDLGFIKESPNFRRKSINIDISQFDNEYLKNLNDYNRILKQRNNYLKSLYLNNNMSRDYLEILTFNLIKTGKKIYNVRKKYIEDINNTLNTYFSKIMVNIDLKLKYVSDYSQNEDNLLKKYHSSLSKELTFGKTLSGIHHDDFIFYMNDVPIKDFGSEGQQKNAIISYKLALINFLNEIKINPIFILDDMFSELDQEKINNIFKILNYDMQIFITTTEIENIDKFIYDKARKILVNNGNIEVIKDE